MSFNIKKQHIFLLFIYFYLFFISYISEGIFVTQDYELQIIVVGISPFVGGSFIAQGPALASSEPPFTINVDNTSVVIPFKSLNSNGGIIYLASNVDGGQSDSVYVYPPKYITDIEQKGNKIAVNFNFNIDIFKPLSLPQNIWSSIGTGCQFISDNNYFDFRPLVQSNQSTSPYKLTDKDTIFYFNLCNQVSNSGNYGLSSSTQSFYIRNSVPKTLGVVQSSSATEFTVLNSTYISILYSNEDNSTRGVFNLGCNVLSQFNYKGYTETLPATTINLNLQSKYACSSKLVSQSTRINETSIEFDIAPTFQSVLFHKDFKFALKIPIEPVITSFTYLSESRWVKLLGLFDDIIYYRFQFGNSNIKPISMNFTTIVLDLSQFPHSNYLSVYYKSNPSSQKYLIEGSNLEFTLTQNYITKLVTLTTDSKDIFTVHGGAINSSNQIYLNSKLEIPFNMLSKTGGYIYIRSNDISSDEKFIYPLEDFIKSFSIVNQTIYVNFNFDITKNLPISYQTPNTNIFDDKNCAFFSNNGDYFDLSPLRLTDSDPSIRYETKPNGGSNSTYYFNICNKVGNSGNYGLTGEVQSFEVVGDDSVNPIGFLNGAHYAIIDVSTVEVDYYNDKRKGKFVFSCDQLSTFFVNSYEDPALTFNFLIDSKFACSSKIIQSDQKNSTTLQYQVSQNNIPITLVNQNLNLYITLPLGPIISSTDFTEGTRLFILKGIFDSENNYQFKYGDIYITPSTFSYSTIDLDFSQLTYSNNLTVYYRSIPSQESYLIPSIPTPEFDFTLKQNYVLKSITIETKSIGDYTIEGSALSTKRVISLKKDTPTIIPFSDIENTGGTVYMKSTTNTISLEQYVYPPEPIQSTNQEVGILSITFTYDLDLFPALFTKVSFTPVDSKSVLYDIIGNNYNNELVNDDLFLTIFLPIETIIYSFNYDTESRLFTMHGSFKTPISQYYKFDYNSSYFDDKELLTMDPNDNSEIILDFLPFFVQVNFTISFLGFIPDKIYIIPHTEIHFEMSKPSKSGITISTKQYGSFEIQGSALIDNLNEYILTKDDETIIPLSQLKPGYILLRCIESGNVSQSLSIYEDDLDFSSDSEPNNGNSDSNSNPNESDKLKIGIAIGAGVLFLIIVASIIFYFKKRKQIAYVNLTRQEVELESLNGHDQ